MRRIVRSVLVLGLAAAGCDAGVDPLDYRTVALEGECETVVGELPPELDGKFDIIDPTTGAHVATVEFSIDDEGRIWDWKGDEVFPVEEGCIPNWSFTGTSERGTEYRLDWDMDAGWWDITNASGTPRALVPR